MKNDYNVHIFDLSSMCPLSGWEQPLYDRFVNGLKDLADTMTRVLPEYYVEASVNGDTCKLVFTRIELPDGG